MLQKVEFTGAFLAAVLLSGCVTAPVKQDIPAKVPVSQPVSEAKIFKTPVNAKPGKICCVVRIGTLSELRLEESLTSGSPYQKPFQIQKKSAAEQIRYSNRKLTQVLDRHRSAITDQDGGRKRIIVRNYLQSFLDPYSEHIKVVDHSNASFTKVVRAVGGNEQQDIASVCFFLTIILQDLKEESSTDTVGNVQVKTTIYTQKAVGNIRDINGNVLKAFHVVGKTSRRQTSTSRSTFFNPTEVLLENISKQIAEKVAAYFVTKLEISCRGPQGNKEFDAEEVLFFVDGKDFENGDLLCAGEHTIKAEAEGYKTITKTITLRNNCPKRVLRLKFRKLAKGSTVPADITPTNQPKYNKEAN